MCLCFPWCRALVCFLNSLQGVVPSGIFFPPWSDWIPLGIGTAAAAEPVLSTNHSLTPEGLEMALLRRDLGSFSSVVLACAVQEGESLSLPPL